jgi:hypothetical protein
VPGMAAAVDRADLALLGGIYGVKMQN